VILNGGSSAGKTTLATAFRDQRAAAGEFWFLIGIDDFLAKLPWRGAERDWGGALAADAIRFEATPDGARAVGGFELTSTAVVSAKTMRKGVSPHTKLGASVLELSALRAHRLCKQGEHGAIESVVG
jgi:chloramphenicol 3-O-phosphotransferase